MPPRSRRARWFLSLLFGLTSCFLLPPLTHAGEDSFLRDFAATRGFTLGRPSGAKPSPDGKTVYFLRARGPRDARQELWAFDVATAQTRRLLAPDDVLGRGGNGGAGVEEERISPEERSRRERQRITAGGFTAFEVSRDGSFILLPLNGKLYVLRLATAATAVVTELTGAGDDLLDPKLSPDSRRVAYVRGGDLYLLELATRVERQVPGGPPRRSPTGWPNLWPRRRWAARPASGGRPTERVCSTRKPTPEGGKLVHADPARPDAPPQRQFYPRPGRANVAVRLGVCPARETAGPGPGGCAGTPGAYPTWRRSSGAPTGR